SGFLDIGVERIVDQVVNPKIMTVFMPQVEDVVYKFLGIEKPKKGKENQNVYVAPLTVENLAKKEQKKLPTLTDLLPKELEPISPESDTLKGKEENSLEDGEVGFADEKEEDSSPPFEPIEIINSRVEESSMDSHLSGISELTSHDSQHSHSVLNMSAPTNITPSKPTLDLSNNDSQLSKVSSGSRLSIVSLGEQDFKLQYEGESNDESEQSKMSNHASCPEGFTEVIKKDIVAAKDIDNNEVSIGLSEESNASSNRLQIYTQENSENNSLDVKEDEEDKIDGLDKKLNELSESKTNNEFDKSLFYVKIENKSDEKQERTSDKELIQSPIADTLINDEIREEKVEIKTEEKLSEIQEKYLENIEENTMKKLQVLDAKQEQNIELVKERNLENIEKRFEEKCFIKPGESTEKKSEDKHDKCEKKIDDRTDRKFIDKSEKKLEEKIEKKVEEKIEKKSEEKIEKKSEEKLEKKSEEKIEKKPEEKYERKVDEKLEKKCEKKHEKQSEEKADKRSSDKTEKKMDEKSSRKLDDKSMRKVDEKKYTDKKLDDKSDRKIEEKKTAEKKSDEKGDKKSEDKTDRKTDKKSDEKKHDKHREERDKSKDRKDEKKRINSESRDLKKTESSHSSDNDKRKSDKDKHKKDHGENRNRSEKSSKHESKETKDKGKREEKSERDGTKEKYKYDSKDDKKTEEKDRKSEKDKSKKEENDIVKHDKEVKKSRSDDRKERDGKEKQKTDEKGKTKHDDKHKERGREKSDREKSSRHDEKSKDSSRSNSKENKERCKQDDRNRGKESSSKSEERKSKDKSKHDEKSNKYSDKGSVKKSESKSSSRSDHKSKDSVKKNKDSKGKSIIDDHRIHRDKNSEDRRSADRDSNGTAQDRSVRNTASHDSQPSQTRHDKSGSTSTSSKSDSGGNSDSCMNSQPMESSMKDESYSSSKSSSPPSSLPFKKRPLSIQSDDENSQKSPKLLHSKIKKPKIAANIFEVKKIMMLRKSLAKKERRQQKELQKTQKMKERVTNVKSDKKIAKPVVTRRKKLGDVEKSLRKEVQTSLSKKQTPIPDVEKEDISEFKYFESEIIPNALNESDSQFLAYVKRLVESDNLSDISTPSESENSEEEEEDDMICLSDINFDEQVANELGARFVKTDKGINVIFDESTDREILKRRRESVEAVSGSLVDFNIIGDTVVTLNVNSRPNSVLSNSSEKSSVSNVKRKRERSSSITSSNSNKSDKIETSANTVNTGKHSDSNLKSRKRIFSRKRSKKDLMDLEIKPIEKRELRRCRKPSTRYSNKEFASYTDEDASFDGFPPEEITLNEDSNHDPKPEIVVLNDFKSSKCSVEISNDDDDDSSDRVMILECVEDGYDIIKDNNNIDKGSSEDERGCGDGSMLNQDLILPTLRDLMVESGFRREDDKSDILPTLANVEDHSEEKSEKISSDKVNSNRTNLGRSRRVGLSKPRPKVMEQKNNEVGRNRTATPDFVMPLSPESDVSGSSVEAKKALLDKVASSSVQSGSLGTPGGRAQRYNSDELYKPRPLFSQGSRRIRGRVSPPLNEDPIANMVRKWTAFD
ncbi:hypothetical protein L9F63_011209, partial [Diploptera punctata]